ncbi:MAG TPA: hypothetical protein VHC69_11865 [Polyangiaceae bacterium]|nr:hypothetical protein [Polyangiaceae bacterium]
MSADRLGFFGRGAAALALVTVSVLAAESCGFPDHQFVDDDLFYGRAGAKSAGAGQGGGSPDASITTTTGGQTGSGGTTPGAGGSGGIAASGNRPGVGADGGIIAIVEGGRGRGGSGGATTTTGDAGPPDGGNPPVEGGPMCAPGLDLCDGKCTDLQSNDANCGKCGTACTGTDVCTGGTCAPPCAVGLTPCTPTGSTVMTCVDTTKDENNCGACNQHCPGGTVCDGSSCLIDCGSLTRCGSQCFDTTKDDQHCGNCNTNCQAMGQVCSGSVCSTSCTTPTTACGNTCVDTSKDDANCGGCGKPCAAKQECVSSQCKTLVENCLNGIDDDRDGLVDCADPDCTTGYTCGSVPAGWQGPFALWSGTPNAAPSCPAAYPTGLFLAHDKLNVPSYACPDCACRPSSDSVCNTLHFWYDTSSNCSASAAWDVAVDPDGACVPEVLSLYSKSFNPLSASIDSAQLTPPDQHSPALPPYAQGSCTPNQIAPSFPNPTWGLDAEGCGLSQAATTGGGCSLGVCMPKPASPFGAKLCIFKAGVTSCPSSYPVSPTSPQYYETWSDSRKCTSCTCGAIGCGGKVTAFTDTNCTQNPTTVDMSGACTTLPKDPTPTGTGTNRQDTLSIRWDDGGPVCGMGASNVVGAATPDSPITVCCQQ